MSGQQRIGAPKKVVWTALNNPDVLKQCIPGCESIEMQSPTDMTARVVLKLGPIKATYSSKLQLLDLDPPNGYRIVGEGSGGAAGFARGSAVVRLADDGPKATLLTYETNVNVGGKIAQLGARLLDSTAKKLAEEFFATFSQVVAPSAGGELAGARQKRGGFFAWLFGLFSRKKPAVEV
ncbi:MAG: carbon monoxide dehydrogenase subunit G [Hyphomicrobium sp.]|uniref:SRPBCC family protein n=1 Tax=Hyphomicrobium sp. TaxID=82 RepID=UPI003D115975